MKLNRNSQAGLTSLAFLFFFLVSVGVASAFSFSPISLSFSPSGENTIQSFKLTNTSDVTVAIKVTMVSREMAVDGTETLKPTDLFAIYPSRIILDASSVQIVKVQWKGPFDVSMEQNFRIIAEQVPVDFNGPKPVNIRILIRYMGAIYITPSNAVPNVVLDSVKHDTQNLAITLYNKGNAHVLMSNLTLQVKTSESFKIYSPEELKGFNGENMLAGLKRTFVVPLPPDMKGEDFSVTFKFDSIR